MRTDDALLQVFLLVGQDRRIRQQRGNHRARLDRHAGETAGTQFRGGARVLERFPGRAPGPDEPLGGPAIRLPDDVAMLGPPPERVTTVFLSGRMAGLELPVLAMAHHYLLTEPIAGFDALVWRVVRPALVVPLALLSRKTRPETAPVPAAPVVARGERGLRRLVRVARHEEVAARTRGRAR